MVFEKIMEDKIGPLVGVIQKNKTIRAIQSGMMMTLPITLGVSLIAILGNLPISAWQEFLANVGIAQVVSEMVSSTLSMMAIYSIAVTGYCYAKNEGENGIISAILATAVFITLMPQSITVGEESVNAIRSSLLGSDGVFVALIVGILVAKIYCYFSKKNLKLKLPETVPPMVSDSLEPVFIGMILFIGTFIIKYAFSQTSFGDIFQFISVVVTRPIMNVGATPWALILVQTLAALLFFFGIHSAVIFAAYSPIIGLAFLGNIEAFIAGESLPFLTYIIVFLCIRNSGTGNTLGLCFSSFFAKSQHFKSLSKLVTVPNIFMINEPVIFGFPIMLNPLFFFPFVLSAIVPGLITLGLIQIFNLENLIFNPLISTPWVTPQIITGFMQGGLIIALFILIAIIVNKILDFALELMN